MKSITFISRLGILLMLFQSLVCEFLILSFSKLNEQKTVSNPVKVSYVLFVHVPQDHKKGHTSPCLFDIQWRIQDFPDGGRQSQRWGSQPIIWPNVARKLHENERNWTQRGREHASLAPPPPRSANDLLWLDKLMLW